MAEYNVTVVGAGVIGLTSAVLLSRKPEYSVTVIAKHMPGDLDIEYTSPWAGAHYFPVGVRGSQLAEWERRTWPQLERLALEVPEAGIHFQDYISLVRAEGGGTMTTKSHPEVTSKEPWYKEVIRDFRTQETGLPPGIRMAQLSTSVCINPTLYLSWLAGECLRHGSKIKRAAIQHINDAATHHHSGRVADLVVNCSGLGSLTLGGVEDKKMYPIRGQTILVRNVPARMASIHASENRPDEPTYVLPRAAGGGTILGGSFQVGEWNRDPDPDLAIRIMKRCIDLCPSLVQKRDGTKGDIEDLGIIRHSVGLRPARENGPRVEREVIRGVKVVHNYGHGAYGYQASYGTAETAAKLVEESLMQRARL